MICYLRSQSRLDNIHLIGYFLFCITWIRYYKMILKYLNPCCYLYFWSRFQQYIHGSIIEYACALCYCSPIGIAGERFQKVPVLPMHWWQYRALRPMGTILPTRPNQPITHLMMDLILVSLKLPHSLCCCLVS